jgi:hypothetical protein
MIMCLENPTEIYELVGQLVNFGKLQDIEYFRAS